MLFYNVNHDGFEIIIIRKDRINITAVHVDIAAEIIKSKKECI